MASTYLTKTPSSAGNRKTWTFSAWIKFGKFAGSAGSVLFSAYAHANDNFKISFGDTHQLSMRFYNGSEYQLTLNRLFRDPNAWYHLVFAVDTTLTSGGDRFKIYVNGVRETSFANANDPTKDLNMTINDTTTMQIGRYSTGNNYFDGSMSHVHLIDGTALAPTVFGSTDSTTGEWQINTDPTISSYGTNGFFILKDGNSTADVSPNNNTFTISGGSLTKTEDCPSNVFCTLNRLNGVQPTGGLNLATGNLTFADGENGSNYAYIAGTLGASSGKFYWETKIDDLAEIDQVGVALASANFANVATSHGLQATTYGGKGCQFSNGNKVGDGSQGAYMGGFSVNHIMMIALDLDNNKITFGRNGSWANGSGGADQTYSNSTPAYTNLTAGEFYVPAQAKRAGGSNYGTNRYNFGNGYFGTTAVSNAGTNASGIGIFEYDVPTGFTALSTKGLNL
jgi:hypothetical protein